MSAVIGRREFLAAVGAAVAWPTAASAQSSAWVDGLANAPTGAAQFPTLLNKYHPARQADGRNKSNGYQPPFNVPGVDYRVGIQTGVVLKSITGNVPAGCSWDGTVLTITETNVTVEGIDFPTGAYIRVNSPTGKVTIKNCRLHGTATDMCLIRMGVGSTATDVYVGYCELMANGCGGAQNAGVIQWDTNNLTNTGTYTIEYCWMDSAGYDCFRPQGGSFHFVLQYCYISNSLGGGHPDVVQQLVSGTTSKMWNNCIYTTHGTQGLGTDPGNIPPCITSQNVHITASGHAFSVAGTGFNAPPYFQFNNNYCDNGGTPSGGYKFVYDDFAKGIAQHTGNYWMKYGQGYYN